MERLNKNIVKKEYKKINIMQFGEGNFLRAFVDFFIDKMNKENIIDSHIVLVQPLEFGRIDDLREQDGLYTLYLNGIDNKEAKRERHIIDVFDDYINPYSEYDKLKEYARSEDLKLIISNTTEAGIVYDENDIDYSTCPKTFPSKILSILKERYEYFNHDRTKGLSFICCELIDDNAKKLKEVLNKLAVKSLCSEEFINWINEACHFSSSLVDRIVPGYPKDEIKEIEEENNYIDTNVVKAEIFHLWVIEKDPVIENIFPIDKLNMNVKYVDSIKPYKIRKVRILNGSHTLLTPVSYLYGNDTVKESMDNIDVYNFVRNFVYDTCIETIDLDRNDIIQFSEDVFDRFKNPYIKHMLMSISLNSISKFKERLLPTFFDAYNKYNYISKHIAFSLASLLIFYKGKRGDEEIKISDNLEYINYINKYKDSNDYVYKVMSNSDFFESDLTVINGFYELVLSYYNKILDKGMKNALKGFNEEYEQIYKN